VKFCSVELIKEVKMNGPNLNRLLKTPFNELEKNCINEALMAAVDTGNHGNVGKLIYRGATCIDEALEKSRTLKMYSVTATLLIVKAAMVDDWILVRTLYGENVLDLPSKIPMTSRDNLSKLQNCVLDRSFKTGVAIEMSRRNNAPKVREELLLRTGIDKEKGYVLWSGLQLTQLDISWLQKVNWVKELILDCNELSSLPTEIGTCLKHCTKVDLKQNKLRKVPYSLFELPYIATLNLSNNVIVEIPNVPQLPASLSVLTLSHNRLRNLPNFVSSKLETLDISSNQFNSIPDCVYSFSSLTTLNISFNSAILTLPNQLGLLKNLHNLNLKGLNNLTHPPENYRASTIDCIRYLNNQLRNASRYFHMKLMVLGKRGVGKSTIVARLQNRQISSSSCSIAISKWKYSPQSSGKRSFNFRIWDFNRREEYDASFHCFLSKRTMYLLLWNVTDGDTGISSLKPFLDSITTQVPGSCVIIVGTFADMLPDEERKNRVADLVRKVQELTAQYKTLFVAGINVVGLQNEIEDLIKLKDDIYNAASEYKLNNECVMGAMIPSSYHTLDKKLTSIYQKLKDEKYRAFMDAVEFRKLIRSKGLTDIRDDDYDEICKTSQFLHEAGALLFYTNCKSCLEDLYILDPSWLYDMISTVVSVRQRRSRGVLMAKDLLPIVKNTGLPLKYMLMLLIRFEIVLPLDEGWNWILIPSLLPKTSPTILPDDNPYFKHLILFSPSSLSYLTLSSFWNKLLSNITISIKEVMDMLNDRISVSGNDVISTSISPSSEILSFNSSCDELYLSDNLSSLQSEAMSPLTNDVFYFKEESVERDGPRLTLPSTSEVVSSVPQLLERHESLSGANLWYWRQGILYSANGLCFIISSLTNNSKHQDKDGILIMCSPTVEGRKVLCQLIELVKQLISTQYPALLKSLEQKVPCDVCIRNGIQDPFEFHVDQLLPLLDSYKLTTQCGASHKVHLRDLVPTELDPMHLIDANKVLKYVLNSGIRTICFTGKSSISNGCFVSPRPGIPTELWMCCDGLRGTELHILKANSLDRINKHYLKDVQVCCMKQCSKYIWVAAQADLGDGIVFIFDKKSQELLFEIVTENIVVSCLVNSNHTMYIGTEDGYCFAIPLDAEFTCIDIWLHQHNKVSEHCIDGLILTDAHLWLSSYKHLYILNATSLDIECREEIAKRHTHVGKVVLSYSSNQVVGAHIGGVVVSTWDASHRMYLYDFDVGFVVNDRCHISNPRNQVITAMCTSLNTIWIGLASGHIIAFDTNCVGQVLTCHKPYYSFVCFLSSVEYPQNGEHMVLSGGKICQPDGQFKDCYRCKDENGQPMDIAGVAILWPVKNPTNIL